MDDHPLGCVGVPPKPVEMRIAADGEIQFRGPTLFQGYWNNPVATTAAFTDDGWYMSGDLGQLDAKGRLHLHGRKRHIIVLPNGFNVYPEDIENALRVAGIRDSVAVETRPGRIEVVVLAPVPTATRRTSGPRSSIESSTPDDLRRQIEAAVKAANASLGPNQRIAGWRLWPEADFPRTHTFKVKRDRVRTWAAVDTPLPVGEDGGAAGAGLASGRDPRASARCHLDPAGLGLGVVRALHAEREDVLVAVGEAIEEGPGPGVGIEGRGQLRRNLELAGRRVKPRVTWTSSPALEAGRRAVIRVDAHPPLAAHRCDGGAGAEWSRVTTTAGRLLHPQRRHDGLRDLDAAGGLADLDDALSGMSQLIAGPSCPHRLERCCHLRDPGVRRCLRGPREEDQGLADAPNDELRIPGGTGWRRSRRRVYVLRAHDPRIRLAGARQLVDHDVPAERLLRQDRLDQAARDVHQVGALAGPVPPLAPAPGRRHPAPASRPARR